MKQLRILSLLPVFLFLATLWQSCNYKKIESNDQACMTASPVSCTGTGIKYRFESGCSLDAPTSFTWEVEGDATKLVGSTVEYIFPEEKKYNVRLTVTTSETVDDTLFVVDVKAQNVPGYAKLLAKPEHQVAQAIAVANDGGYVICGVNEDIKDNPTKTTMFLTKTKSDGTVEWHFTYSYPGADYTRGNGVTSNPDGTFTCAGTTKIGGKRRVYVARIAADGALIESKSFENGVDQEGYYISRTATGDYLIAGQDYGNYGTGIVLTINSSLEKIGTPLLTGGPTVKQVKSLGTNSYLMVGSRYLPFDSTYSSFPPVLFAAKYSDNVINWATDVSLQYNTARIEEGFSITPLSDGTYASCGVTKINGQKHIYLTQLDNGGTRIKTYALPDGIVGTDIIEAADGGGVIIAGTFSDGDQFNEGNDNFLLLKVSLTTGQVIWKTKLFGQSGVKDDAYALSQASDCGYIIVGRSAKGNADGSFDSYLVKTNFNGEQ